MQNRTLGLDAAQYAALLFMLTNASQQVIPPYFEDVEEQEFSVMFMRGCSQMAAQIAHPHLAMLFDRHAQTCAAAPLSQPEDSAWFDRMEPHGKPH